MPRIIGDDSEPKDCAPVEQEMSTGADTETGTNRKGSCLSCAKRHQLKNKTTTKKNRSLVKILQMSKVSYPAR